MDDVAVETERLLVFVGAGMAVVGAEAVIISIQAYIPYQLQCLPWSIHSQFLAAQVFPDRGKGIVVGQIRQVLPGNLKRRDNSSRHGESSIYRNNDCVLFKAVVVIRNE